MSSLILHLINRQITDHPAPHFTSTITPRPTIFHPLFHKNSTNDTFMQCPFFINVNIEIEPTLINLWSANWLFPNATWLMKFQKGNVNNGLFLCNLITIRQPNVAIWKNNLITSHDLVTIHYLQMQSFRAIVFLSIFLSTVAPKNAALNSSFQNMPFFWLFLTSHWIFKNSFST